MRFHFFRPLHGWREFIHEVVIVVIGVLLALAGAQLIDTLQKKGTAADTRHEVTDELNSDLMSMALRQSIEPCIGRRLSELRAIVAQWEKSGSFETPKWVAQSTPIEIELSRYDSALSAGRLALLSGEEQYRMGAVASRIRRFNEWQFADRLVWGRLRALQFGPAALSAEDRAIIRSALQDAATYDYEIQVNTAEALPMARRYGFAPDAKGFREMAPTIWPGGRFTPSICTSIDTPPEEGNKRVVIPLAL